MITVLEINNTAGINSWGDDRYPHRQDLFWWSIEVPEPYQAGPEVELPTEPEAFYY